MKLTIPSTINKNNKSGWCPGCGHGIIIRMLCSGISVLGRITSGVKLINLKEHEEVASIAKVRRASGELEENAEETAEEANTEATAETVVEEQTEE